MSERDDATRLPVPTSAAAITTPTPRPLVPGQAAPSSGASPLSSYVEIVRRRGRVLLLTAGAIFAAACLLTFISPHVYEATATMLVSRAGSAATSGFEAADRMGSVMTPMATPDQQKRVGELLAAEKLDTRKQKLDYLEGQFGRKFTSAANLTAAEAEQLIGFLTEAQAADAAKVAEQ